MVYPVTPRPCPFGHGHNVTLTEIDPGVWVVCCNTCHTIGPHGNDGQTPDQAIAGWNERAYEAQ